MILEVQRYDFYYSFYIKKKFTFLKLKNEGIEKSAQNFWGCMIFEASSIIPIDVLKGI